MANKQYFGIDVSSWNGTPDFTKAKGLDFVILRVTEKNGIDKSFESNYKSATKAGLKVGVYKYSYAKNSTESKREAEDVIETLSGRHLDFPVFLDLEWKTQETFSKSQISSIIEVFRDVIEKAGYKFGIYCNKNWYNNLIPADAKKKYDFWIASVPADANDDGTVHETLRPAYGIGWQYSWKGKVSGLSGGYDADVFYTLYEDEKTDTKGTKEEAQLSKTTITASDVVKTAQAWVGKKESDGSHKVIIDTYNAYKPLTRGYKVSYTDAWCDTFVSAVFIKLDAVDLIGGTECGVENHVQLFKKAGIWNEDGTITPKAGDIIVYNWDKSTQPNDGAADHIGIVKSVSSKTIKVIEGNYKDSVAIRSLSVGNGYIRGYAQPKYGEGEAKDVETKPATQVPADEPVTSVPAVADEPITPSTGMVRMGDDGPSVKYMQYCLKMIGFNLAVDGIFGTKTYAALTSFQNSNALYVDGICGPHTWGALLNEVAKKETAKSVMELAKEVLAGKWGNQPDREKNLKAAGYKNYQEIQNEVNKLLKS